MKKFILKFGIDVDNSYEQFHDLFLYKSVIITYIHSFVPPNKATYIVGPLSQEGVDNWIKYIKSYGWEPDISVKEYTEELKEIMYNFYKITF